VTIRPLDTVLANLRDEPSRTGSVVVTIYGDAIVPRGGSVWLGTLTAILSALGVAEGAVRTAMSRLAADGWLTRSRTGRNSFYRLAEKGRATFAAATKHIYHPAEQVWDGRLTLAFAQGADEAAWREAGFGQPLPGLWIAPAGGSVPPVGEEAMCLSASGAPPAMAALAASAWPLDRTKTGYRRFIATFGPLAEAVAGGLPLSDLDSLAVRVLLIHDYRRVVLRDPLLPAPLLPADWPGTEARRLCGGLYHAVLEASERWLDANGLTEAGILPSPGPDLRRRFR
jgi:phenylacetic acid degradation operon negative regulatory protein